MRVTLVFGQALPIVKSDKRSYKVVCPRIPPPDFGLAKFMISAGSRARLWLDTMVPGIRGSPIAMDCLEVDSQDARFLNESPTQSGDLLGTPAYMAPEQTTRDQAALGAWTDVYALGIVLYQILSGKLPFQATSVSQLFDKIQRCAPPPLGRDVPAVLVDICFRCLSRKPEDRYQSAGELGEALQRFVSDRELHRSAGKKWWQLWR